MITVALALARVVPLLDPRRASGYGVNWQYVPEGALRYLDRVGVDGRLYNTFSMGGYIEWRDFPRRVPIIDGRGYLPADLFEEVHHAGAYGQHLNRLQATYGFDVAVVDYPIVGHFTAEWVPPEHDFAWASPQWALVYWDDNALVYLRRTERLKPIIDRDEYRHVKPANGPTLLMRRLDNPTTARAVEVELRRNVDETGSAMGLTLLGFTALQVGAFDEALAAFRRVDDPSRLPNAAEGLAIAHWRQGNVTEALAAYQRRLALGEDHRLLFSVGVCLIKLGRAREAIAYLERARQRDPFFPPVYPALLDAYRQTGVVGYEDELASGYSAAQAHAKATEHIARARQQQQAGRFEEAAAELTTAIALEPGNAVAVSQLGYVRLFLGRIDEAIAQQRAALQLDPRLAQAHYGLGLAYRARGNQRLAKEHFAAYVRLEPKTYYAWLVRHDRSL
jgi:tetratricopeptide (TPR) repeat protein